MRSSLLYVTKEDESPLCWGIDLAVTLAKKNGKAAFLAHLCARGASLSELMEEDPGYMLQNLSKVQTFLQTMTIINQRKKMNGKELQFSLASGGIDASLLVSWLQENVRRPREFKQKQMWVWSPPNMGKTSMILKLEEHLSVYWAPLEGVNDDLYDDDTYDLVVFDEYYGQRKLTWMNSFLQGSPMSIHRRFHSTMKYKNLPCIILSNFTPEHCYRKCSEDAVAPLLARIHIINLNTFTSINIQEVNDQ